MISLVPLKSHKSFPLLLELNKQSKHLNNQSKHLNKQSKHLDRGLIEPISHGPDHAHLWIEIIVFNQCLIGYRRSRPFFFFFFFLTEARREIIRLNWALECPLYSYAEKIGPWNFRFIVMENDWALEFPIYSYAERLGPGISDFLVMQNDWTL